MNEELLKRLDAIGLKLGVASEHIWGILLKQARIQGILDLSIALVLLTGAAFLLGWAIRLYKEDEDDWPVVFSAAGIIMGLLSTGMFYNATSALANPEYWALKTLLEAAK